VYLRGAQEEMWHKLLQLQFAPNPGVVLTWMVGEGIEATLRAYGSDLRQAFAASRDGPRTITRWTSSLRSAMNATPGHMSLFTSLQHAAVTENDQLLFVNAGVNSSQPFTEQRDAFWWGGRDILEFSAPFSGFRRVIRGFDRERRGLVESEHAVSLDAGAGRGGRLLAAAFALDGAVVDHIEF
jgi:serine/threonine protein phosphatase 1